MVERATERRERRVSAGRVRRTGGRAGRRRARSGRVSARRGARRALSRPTRRIWRSSIRRATSAARFCRGRSASVQRRRTVADAAYYVTRHRHSDRSARRRRSAARRRDDRRARWVRRASPAFGALQIAAAAAAFTADARASPSSCVGWSTKRERRRSRSHRGRRSAARPSRARASRNVTVFSPTTFRFSGKRRRGATVIDVDGNRYRRFHRGVRRRQRRPLPTPRGRERRRRSSRSPDARHGRRASDRGARAPARASRGTASRRGARENVSRDDRLRSRRSRAQDRDARDRPRAFCRVPRCLSRALARSAAVVWHRALPRAVRSGAWRRRGAARTIRMRQSASRRTRRSRRRGVLELLAAARRRRRRHRRADSGTRRLSSFRPTGICARCARCATRLGIADDRRRNLHRLRPDGHVVRGRARRRRSRHSVHRQGDGVGLSRSAPTIGRAAVMDAWPPSTGEALHTSTYLGNPMGCAAALATIDEIERRELAARARRLRAVRSRRGSKLCGTHPAVRDVRGRGLLWGVQLRDAAAASDVVKRVAASGRHPPAVGIERRRDRRSRRRSSSTRAPARPRARPLGAAPSRPSSRGR